MDLFEKYQDVLQNIEFAIVSIYREKLEMTDYAVMRSSEAIINHYSAEKTGKGPRNYSLDETEKRFFGKCNLFANGVWDGHHHSGCLESSPYPLMKSFNA
jgi:hypothetical protein